MNRFGRLRRNRDRALKVRLRSFFMLGILLSYVFFACQPCNTLHNFPNDTSLLEKEVKTPVGRMSIRINGTAGDSNRILDDDEDTCNSAPEDKQPDGSSTFVQIDSGDLTRKLGLDLTISKILFLIPHEESLHPGTVTLIQSSDYDGPDTPIPMLYPVFLTSDLPPPFTLT